MKKNGWSIVAKAYDYVYSPLVHAIDNVIMEHLGERIKGAKVLDGCCGTGQITFKSINMGAEKVTAVDNNPDMINQMKQRKEYWMYNGSIDLVEADICEGIISELGNFDIMYFRRCLYFPRQTTVSLLSEAYSNLNQGGSIIIVHPEKNLRKYCENKHRWFAPTHLARRVLACVGKWSGSVEYRPYTAVELEKLCLDACPNGTLISLDAPLPAYNIKVIEKGK